MDSQFKIRAFFRQFPFLSAIEFGGSNHRRIDIGRVEEVHVNRIDKDFLGVVPQYDGATGSCVDIDDSERILLLDQDGNVLVEARQQDHIHHNEAHTDNEYRAGESVGEALLRIDNPDAVMFAVRIHTGYEIRDHYSVGGYSVTLYKAPKGFSLGGWVEEQLRRASEQILATVAEIDAEGE